MYPQKLVTTEIKLAINSIGHNDDYEYDAMIEFLQNVNSIDVVLEEVKRCPGVYVSIIIDQLDEFLQHKATYDDCIIVTSYDDECDTPQTTQDELDLYYSVYATAQDLFDTLQAYYDSKYC